jgi:hypothetical protein
MQDVLSVYDHDHTRTVIATARNAAGSNPEVLGILICMDCFVGCADAQ